jgi:hypothetical protein
MEELQILLSNTFAKFTQPELLGFLNIQLKILETRFPELFEELYASYIHKKRWKLKKNLVDIITLIISLRIVNK